MTDMPRGKVRPAIEAPHVGNQNDERTGEVRKVMLTSYRFLDDSEYTLREFDYRLRWTLEAKHSTMTSNGRSTIGWAKATVDMWSRRDGEWHEVWTLSSAAESPYSTDGRAKTRSWNALLDELAEQATTVLL